MAMSYSLSKPLYLKNLHLISNSSSRRPCLISSLRFHPLSSGHHVFYDPMLIMEQHQRKNGMAVKSSTQPIPPSTDSVAISTQKGGNWVIEFVVRLLVPFLKSRWEGFLWYKKGVDEVIERAEEVAEMVEKVAEEVELKAEELVEELPDGNMKNTIRFVENVAHRAATDAHAAETAISKIEMFEDEVDSYIDPNLVKDRKKRKQEEERQIKQAFEDFEQNHFDIFGALFADHDILDCLLYHFTSLFRE